jgi:hypothetical protein
MILECDRCGKRRDTQLLYMPVACYLNLCRNCYQIVEKEYAEEKENPSAKEETCPLCQGGWPFCPKCRPKNREPHGPVNDYAKIAQGWSIIFDAPITARQVERAMKWVEICGE